MDHFNDERLLQNLQNQSPTASEVISEQLSSSDSENDAIDTVAELESNKLLDGIKGSFSKVFKFVKGDTNFISQEDYAEH